MYIWSVATKRCVDMNHEMRCNRFSFPSLSSQLLSSLSSSTFFLLFECLSFLGIRFTMSPTLGSSTQRRKEKEITETELLELNGEKIEKRGVAKKRWDRQQNQNKWSSFPPHPFFPSPSSSFFSLLTFFFFLSFSSFLPKGTKRKKQSKTEKG